VPSLPSSSASPTSNRARAPRSAALELARSIAGPAMSIPVASAPRPAASSAAHQCRNRRRVRGQTVCPPQQAGRTQAAGRLCPTGLKKRGERSARALDRLADQREEEGLDEEADEMRSEADSAREKSQRVRLWPSLAGA
jgi:hypothetical protein